jgi:hypothetical protein
MGAGPCHLLIVKCKDNVTVFHFSVLDSPSKSLKLFTWPSGCTAIVCGGEEVKQSNCLGDDVLSSAAEAGIAVVGVSEKSGCGVSDNGDWWHLSL